MELQDAVQQEEDRHGDNDNDEPVILPPWLSHLKRKPYPELCCEWNADRGAGAEEITERAGRNLQLIQACDRLRLRTIGVEAERRGVE